MLENLRFIRAFLFIFLMLGILQLHAQQRTVTGIVTDAESGETLIGVNVTFGSDMSQGTVTDLDGKYQLTVPDTLSSLRYSYVGYATQLIPITSDVINVVLAPGEELQEVVVIGYGTQKTKEVTSAITRVKPEDFNSGNISDPIQLIQGRVAGVSISKPGGDPNQDFNVRIRGLSTFGSNTEPLIIIDGVQGTVALMNSLDPTDVASFDVLKDASAAAIYGTKAASGVIIITTKRGKYVAGDQKTFNLTFNTDFTTDMVAKNIDVLSADDYLMFPNATNYNNNTDWMDEITQNAFQQAYNLAAHGATKNSSYRVSFNYRGGNGVVKSTGYQQLNGRLNFTQKGLNDMLTLDFNLSATTRDEEYAQSEAMTFTARYNPTAPVMATTDSLDAFSQEWGGYFQRQAFSFYNPVAIIDQGTLDGNKNDIIGSLRAVLEPIKGLKLSGFYSVTQANELYGSYWSKQAYWTPYGTGVHKGFARKETKNQLNQLFEITANYEKRWEKISFNVMGGYSWQQQVNDEFWAFGEGFLSDGFSYNNLGSASVNKANKETMHSYKSERELIGFFARASFTVLDGIYLTGSFRRDGSTMFGENNQWGNFPAVSAGVDIARFVEIPFVDQLKLRGGYGITGNLPPEPYLSQERFNVTNEQFFYNGEYIQAFGPVRNANPDLQWETKAEFDIGLDFFLWDYKISGSIDYYQSNSSNLLLEYKVPVPPYAADRMWLNLGELKNSGLEFAVNWKVFEKPKWGWSTGLNFSYYFDTELVKITSDIVDQDPTLYLGELGAPFLTGVNTILVQEGQPIGQIIAPIYVGIDSTGMMQYQTPSDTVNSIGSDPAQYDDYVTVGSGLPDFEFGWGNNFNIGKFTISFFLRGVFGHSLVNVNNARYGVPVVMGIQSGMNQALDFMDATNGPVYSNVHVEKADFVSLDNFSLGYQFDFKQSKYVQNLRIYFSGQNLFTITNYSGVSPEVRYGDARDNDNPLAPGIDRENTYFRTRSFTLGASIAF